MKIQEAMASLKQEIADIEEMHKIEHDPRFRKEHSLDVLKTITDFTEKVLGEPSLNSVRNGFSVLEKNYDGISGDYTGTQGLKRAYKAMIKQLKKEVEDDND